MTAAKLYFCWMHKNTHVCKHGFVCVPLLECMEGFHHGHHQPRGSDLLVEHTERTVSGENGDLNAKQLTKTKNSERVPMAWE